jgi:hypothetical protein
MRIKKAIELQPGDDIVSLKSRPNINLYRGPVATTTVVDAGVQINYLRGGHVTVAEDDQVEIKS